jgi:hypothetical protein
VAQEIELDRFGLITNSLSTIGVVVAQASGIKKPQSIWFDPVANIRRYQEAREIVSRPTALLILKVLDRLPPWAIGQLDLEMIKMVAN